ncbi:MAG: sigma-70 family RNA polymerase sigma factor [Clostridiales Family XIII bacterium]|jgi:RNA polymerase sigma-70 factor (ECF subfamily)|nr:sigma-70 family RNA polymerase sigma factor [Clostridiales Family XIII bacterium]
MSNNTTNRIGGNLSGEALTRTIERAMRGDVLSFETLYRKYIDDIFYQCKTLLYDKECVDDAVSETVLNFYRSIPKLRSPLAFYAFLSRIIANTCHSFNRKKRAVTVSIEDYEDALVTSEGVPEDEFESAERVTAVRSAMERLPEKQRLCLFMYYYRDMAYKDIADALKITQRTVGTNIMKAKRKMKTMLENEAFGTEVQGAVRRDIASSLPPLRKEALFAVCDGKIVAALQAGPPPGQSGPGVSGVSAVKVAAAFTAAITLAGGAYAVNAVITDAPTPALSAPARDQDIPAYAPDAEIVFENAGGSSGTENPGSARLDLSAGRIREWRVEGADGKVAASGSGREIGADIMDALGPGEYTASWEAHDEYGGIALISREFSISKTSPELSE